MPTWTVNVHLLYTLIVEPTASFHASGVGPMNGKIQDAELASVGQRRLSSGPFPSFLSFRKIVQKSDVDDEEIS